MIRLKILSVLSLFLWSIYGNAQTDYNVVPEVTDVILINDVYIHQNPLDSFGIGDILIEGGLIKKIAKEIEAPYNAKVIDADSIHAYPAFIDAFGNTAIPKPEGRPERSNVDFPGHPSNKVAGITPENEASELIKANDKSIAGMRKSGFGIAHVVPRGRMLPGQGCVISLTGDVAEEMIIRKNNSLLFQFTGARGVYPSTVIAVMSKWREMYTNAKYYDENMKQYSESNGGVARTKYNESLSALVPATKKEMPVFHNASGAKDVYRSLVLQKDLGYKMILADVKQADAAIESAKAGILDIILSLDLPKDDSDSSKGKSDRRGGKAGAGDKKAGKDTSDKKEKKEKEDDPVTKALKEKKQKSVKMYLEQASRLEKAGIAFAFSMMSSNSKDLKSNIDKLVKAGLSKEAAMSALTINAARILGIDDIAGTLEPGKMANVILCTSDYFDKESAIKYSILEGSVEEYEIKKKEKAESGSIDKSLYGEWSFTAIIGDGTNTGVFNITDSNGEIEIEIIDSNEPNDPLNAENISYKDGTLNFTVIVPMTEEGVQVSISLEMEEDDYSGTVSLGEMGTGEISGTKISSPEK